MNHISYHKETMKEQIQKPFTVKRWTLMTCAGGGIGILLIFGLGALTETLGIGGDSGGQAGIGIGMGAGVGWMQAIALRKHIQATQKWFWFSVLGFSASYILFDIIVIFIPVDLRAETVLPLASALGAAFAGWLQYYFLLKSISPRAKRWVIYNCGSWLLAHLFTESIFLINMGKEPRYIIIPLIFIMLLVGGGPLLGILTGRFFVSVFKKENTP